MFVLSSADVSHIRVISTSPAKTSQAQKNDHLWAGTMRMLWRTILHGMYDAVLQMGRTESRKSRRGRNEERERET